MSEESKSEDGLSRWLPAVLGLILAVALAALVVNLIVYVRYFPDGIQSDHTRWGEFGDFLGGTLNPIFALLGLLALLLTIVLQNRELRNSTRELANSVRALNEQGEALRLQNFERTFFEMVRLHHDIVGALDFGLRPGGTERMTGRNGFRALYDKFKAAHGDANTEYNNEEQAVIVEKAYSKFYEQNQSDIGHYFRHLHRILKFVDESEAVTDKGNYSGILRAQLSSFELALLFYDALHHLGIKLKPLIEKYSMLENMDVSLLGNPPDEIVLFESRAFGDQDLSRFARQG